MVEVADELTVDVTVVREVASPVAGAITDGELEFLVRDVLAAEEMTGVWSVAIVFVSDEHLQRLHLQFMGIDEPTDVMTFPAGDGDDPHEPEAGGDVVVSVDRAVAQAAEHGNDPAAELRFLVVHGLLHLAGWDDASDDDRSAMLARGADLLGLPRP